MSADNIVGLVLAIVVVAYLVVALVSRRGSDVGRRPQASCRSASWSLLLAAVHVPLGDYMARVYHVDQALARRARACTA